jgi:hypothetical protein
MNHPPQVYKGFSLHIFATFLKINKNSLKYLFASCCNLVILWHRMEAKMRKRKQHWYVGEIIKSIGGHDTHEVISAMNGKEKFKDGYPKGYTKPKCIVWYYETRDIDSGYIFRFNVAQVDEDERRELITPVQERLWNL